MCRTKMIPIWLGTGIFLSLGFFCRGNGCQREVKLEPQDAFVKKGNKLKFTCSIPQCFTADYPDTKFRMEHNDTAFGQMRKMEEISKGLSIAYFEKEFTGNSDAGVYKCIMSTPGLEEVKTNFSVIFLYHSEEQLLIWSNEHEFPKNVPQNSHASGFLNIGMVAIIAGTTAGAVFVVVVVLGFVCKQMRCCEVRSDISGGGASHNATAKNRAKEQSKAGAEGSTLISTEKQPKSGSEGNTLTSTDDKTDDKQVIEDEAHAHWTVSAMNWNRKQMSSVVHFFRGPSAESTNAGKQA